MTPARSRLGTIVGLTVLFLGLVGCAKRAGGGPGEREFHPWEDSLLRATGTGLLARADEPDARERLKALQTAKGQATAKLREEILEISVDPTQRVRDVVAEHPDWGRRLDAYIRSARWVDTRFIAGRGFEVEAEIYLGARFKSILGMKPKEVPTPKVPVKTAPEPAFGYPSVGAPGMGNP